ncbi:MAG: hypothetical protein GTN76_06415 [Candidatus Aenigmarchaeota archaeon]|nr:hypothetical protein [Candidatus Aenigmarchaeota archaeon]
MVYGIEKRVSKFWGKCKNPILIIIPVLLLVVPKALTGLELGDGLPRVAEAVKLSQDPNFLLYPLPPLWYYMSAVVWILTQNIRIVGLVSPAITCMLIYTTYIFMKRFMNERIALLTYVFLLFTPELIARGMSSYLEPLAAIFILLTLDFYLREKPVKSGIMFGLAQLSKYSSLFFIPALITQELITSRNLRKVASVILIMAVISSPLLIRNYILYNNPTEPWDINAAPGGAGEHFSFFGNPLRFLGMTYSSYYFSSTNVGEFVPDETHFATGALLFDWGTVVTMETPGERILRIHVFDIIASGLLFLLMIYGAFSLYRYDRKKFLIVINIIFWYALLFVPWSLRALAPATRYVLIIFPFLALFSAFGFHSFQNKIKNEKLRYTFYVIIFLCLIYLYILQIERALLFLQHYNEIINHPYIVNTFGSPLYHLSY